MGWQDDPVVSKPAWASDPVVNPTQAALAQQSPSFAKQLLMSPVGGAEMLLKRGTGALAAVPAGVAYGGAAIGKAFGADVNPAQVQSNVQNYLTYQPASESGKAGEATLANITRPIVAPVVKAADQAATAVGKVSPTAETYLREAPSAFQAAAGVLPIASAAPTVMSAVKDLATSPRTVTPEVAEATQAGLKLTPEQANSGIIGRSVQSLSGSAKLERAISKENAPVVNSLAKQEIGIPDDQPLTASTLKQAKAAPNAIYDAVSKLGDVPVDKQFVADVAGIDNRTGSGSFAFDVPASVEKLKTGYGNIQSFDAGDAVAKIRQLRADSSRNIKAPNAPEQNALGYAQRQLSDALEGQLDRYVGRLSQIPESGVSPDLIAQLRGARQQLAKIHSVEDALDGSNVSAKALAKQQDRGVPLSGNLKTIANAYQNFDRSLQDVSKIRDSGPFGVLDLGYGAAAGFAHPAAASAVLARPAARAALASDLYQKLGVQGVPTTTPGAITAPVSPQPILTPQVAAMLAAARAKAAQSQQVTPP